jgi:hypothetical protein
MVGFLMMESDRNQWLLNILTGSEPSKNLPEGLHAELLYQGALFSLARDGSDEAVKVLTETGERCPAEPVRLLALEFLANLAEKGLQTAAEALIRSFFETGREEISSLILERKLRSKAADHQAVFWLLTGQSDLVRKEDPDYIQLTTFYNQAAQPLRDRLLTAASKYGLDNWSVIVTACNSDDEASYLASVENFSIFTANEQQLLLSELEKRTIGGSASAADALCQIFIKYDDSRALHLAQELVLAPREQVERALFYFLSGQWDLYETLDFNHSLISTAYNTANNDLRRRLLALSRLTGRNEWLSSLPGSFRSRWLGDMDDLDWDHAVRHLVSTRNWENLWRLSLVGTPFWSAQMIAELSNAEWKPSSSEEEEFLSKMALLARTCAQSPLVLPPSKSIKTGVNSSTCLSVRSDCRQVAVGGMTSTIQLFPLPDGAPADGSVSGPAAITRALTYDRSGEYLAAASGDNQVRIFRLAEEKVIKAIVGHTNIIRSICLHPDQRTLFSASFDGSVRAWRFPQGTDLGTLDQSSREVHTVCVSYDGSMVLSAGADRTIRVFSWPERQFLREMQGHTAVITLLCASQSSPLVASYGADRTIRIWNYASGILLKEIDAGSETILTSMALMSGDRLLAAGDDRGNISFFSTSTGNRLFSTANNGSHQRVVALSEAPGINRLVSSSTDGILSIWSTEIIDFIQNPIAGSRPDKIQVLQKSLATKKNSKTEQNWLEFTLELMKWHQRFEVELAEISMISAGEFDIELT